MAGRIYLCGLRRRGPSAQATGPAIVCGQATLAHATAEGATGRDTAACELAPRPTGAASGNQAAICLARALWADGRREVETARPAADTVCRGVSGRHRATLCPTKVYGHSEPLATDSSATHFIS